MTEEASWERTNVGTVVNHILVGNEIGVRLLCRNAHLCLLQQGCTSSNAVAGPFQRVSIGVESEDMPPLAIFGDICETITNLELSCEALTVIEFCNRPRVFHVAFAVNLYMEIAVVGLRLDIACAHIGHRYYLRSL